MSNLHPAVLVAVLLHMVVFTTQMDTRFTHQVIIAAIEGDVDDFCGGSLVDYSWALSSFTCIKPLFDKFKEIDVISGFTETQERYKQTRKAVKYLSNENSDELFRIALVNVDIPFSQTNGLLPAVLPLKNENVCKRALTVSVFPHTDTASLLTLGQMTFKKNETSKKFASLYGTTKEVMGLGKWITKSSRRSGNVSESKAMYVGKLYKTPSHVCAGSKGWPLYCGNKLFGIETRCKESDARKDVNVANYASVGSELDFITKAFGITINISRKQGKIAWFFSRGSSLHQNWKQFVLVVVVVTVQILYRFVIFNSL